MITWGLGSRDDSIGERRTWNCDSQMPYGTFGMCTAITGRGVPGEPVGSRVLPHVHSVIKLRHIDDPTCFTVWLVEQCNSQGNCVGEHRLRHNSTGAGRCSRLKYKLSTRLR